LATINHAILKDEEGGKLGGVVRGNIQQFSWAPQRFEADFDISCMFRWIDEFSKRMRGLFLEARVLQELPDVEDEMQTCAVLAARNAMSCPTLHVDGKVYSLWPRRVASGSLAKKEVEEAMEGAQAATQAFLDRLISEIPQNDPRMQLRVFDLQQWQRGDEASRTALVRFVRLWLQELGFDRVRRDRGAQQYQDAVSRPQLLPL
ncbi:unnamed protein product, partial [Symbiodinium microadriaticum]